MTRFRPERLLSYKAASAARRKQHAPERVTADLLNSGVQDDIAKQALCEVHDAADSSAIVRQLVEKKMPSLRKVDPIIARRRLVGMLQRRGFEYEVIGPILDDVLGESE